MIVPLAGPGKSSILAMSVKRKRALLASNPPRNSRPELIADDGQGAFLPARPIAWAGPVGPAVEVESGSAPRTESPTASARGREAAPRPEFTSRKDTSDR